MSYESITAHDPNSHPEAAGLVVVAYIVGLICFAIANAKLRARQVGPAGKEKAPLLTLAFCLYWMFGIPLVLFVCVTLMDL